MHTPEDSRSPEELSGADGQQLPPRNFAAPGDSQRPADEEAQTEPLYEIFRSGFGRSVLRRFRDMVVTLFLMSLLLFLVFQILPGDPITMMLGTQGSPEKRAALEAELQLGRSPLERYAHSISGLFDPAHPSKSLRFQKPVRSLMQGRLRLTCFLSLYAFVLIILMSIPLALLSYAKQGSALDRFISLLAQFFMSIPGFFMGILLILLFGFLFQQYDPGAYSKAGKGFSEQLAALSLPAFSLALPKLSQAVQFLRTALIEGQEEEYLRTARSKGAGPARLLFCHLLRNSLLPYLTALALILAELLTGSLVAEQVFVLPGIGRMLFTAIESRDLPLAQGILMTLGFIVVLINFTVDMLCYLVDPRLRSAEAVGNERGGDV